MIGRFFLPFLVAGGHLLFPV